MGNAFADYFKPIARYNSERGIWYVYDGSVWRADSENLCVAELAKLLADKLYLFALEIKEEDARKRFIDRVKKLQLRRNRDTMLKDAKSVFPIAMKNFDRDIYLFNMANGTLDLRTGEFREHRPEDFLTKVSPVVYDQEARCDRFIRFMDEVMMGDQDTARYTQKALGYALSGDTRMECFFILYGATSRNGKGTLMETFLRLMGDYGRNADPVFNRHFKENEQDRGLKAQFAEPDNMAGIFNWVYEGFKLFIREGLEMPQAVKDATADYELESDKVGQFANLCLRHAKGEELRCAAVFDIYKRWCEANNTKALSQPNFKKELEQKYTYEVRRPWKEKGNATAFWNDCAWVQEEDDGGDVLKGSAPEHIEKLIQDSVSETNEEFSELKD